MFWTLKEFTAPSYAPNTKVAKAQQKVDQDEPTMEQIADNPMLMFGAYGYYDASLIAGFKQVAATRDYMNLTLKFLEELEDFEDDIRLVARHTASERQPIAAFYQKFETLFTHLTSEVNSNLSYLWRQYGQNGKLTYDEIFDSRHLIYKAMSDIIGRMRSTLPILPDNETQVLAILTDSMWDYLATTRQIQRTFEYYLNNLIKRGRISEFYPDQEGTYERDGSISWTTLTDEQRGFGRINHVGIDSFV